jgi:hypothetical protein
VTPVALSILSVNFIAQPAELVNLFEADKPFKLLDEA